MKKTLAVLLLVFLALFGNGSVEAGSVSGRCGADQQCTHVPGNNELWVYRFRNTGSPCWGLISYHSGIGYTDGNGTSRYWIYANGYGVFTASSCNSDYDGYIYISKTLLGRLSMTMTEVQDVIDRLGGKKGLPCSIKNDADDCFTGTNYNLSTWNCNHFTAWVADEFNFFDNYPSGLWYFRHIGKR